MNEPNPRTYFTLEIKRRKFHAPAFGPFGAQGIIADFAVEEMQDGMLLLHRKLIVIATDGLITSQEPAPDAEVVRLLAETGYYAELDKQIAQMKAQQEAVQRAQSGIVQAHGMPSLPPGTKKIKLF